MDSYQITFNVNAMQPITQPFWPTSGYSSHMVYQIASNNYCWLTAIRLVQ